MGHDMEKDFDRICLKYGVDPTSKFSDPIMIDMINDLEAVKEKLANLPEPPRGLLDHSQIECGFSNGKLIECSVVNYGQDSPLGPQHIDQEKRFFNPK